MKIVTIKRSKWSRGLQTISGGNYLLVTRENAKKNEGLIAGNMCCLGFVCLAEGALPEDIQGLTFPKYVKKEVQLPFPLTVLGGACMNTAFVDEAAPINDDKGMPEYEREEKLTKLAAKHGYEFRFVD